MRWLVLLLPSLAWAGEANLSWTAPTQDTAGNPLTGPNALTEYRLYERCGAAPYGSAVQIPASQLNANRPGLPDGQTCFWQLSAVNQFGESLRSNEVSKTFPAIPPPLPQAPTNLVITWAVSPPQPTEPPMAYIQTASSAWAFGTVFNATFGSNVAVGELVVAFVPYESGTNINVTFSNSGTATLSSWTEVAECDIVDAGDGYGQEVAYARVTGAGTLTVTGTLASSDNAGVMAATFDEMPNPLVLQDQQYDRVNISNPDGGDLVPSEQPAWVIGIGATWGGTTAPGVDTGAGFSDAGTGIAVSGTPFVRFTYQRITSTANIDIEFTGTQPPYHISGLIFTEVTGVNNAIAWIRAN